LPEIYPIWGIDNSVLLCYYVDKSVLS